VTFYKLANGGFSLAHYTRRDADPDVKRDREFIEDATFYIAEAMKKEAAIPVTLVYVDGPTFVGPDGKFGLSRHEEYPTTEAAIQRACELMEGSGAHSLAIRETKDTSGKFLWTGPELEKEWERRTLEKEAEVVVAIKRRKIT
jgi:hypothetical protein